LRSAGGRQKFHGRLEEDFLKTALAHGIPLKVLLLGVFAGNNNSAIVLPAMFLE